ncbi:hypothetical protein CUMW_047870 [Citrus unshiu]|nr:hypothetical protein CUMW_047870 [Citrus unshiu]
MEGFSRQQRAETNRTKTKTMATDSNPGQNTLRCHHCAGPLSMKMETSEWTVAPFIRDSFSMIGTAVGGTTSAFYGFNHGKVLFSFCHLSDASCPEMGKRTHVVAFPSWCK